MKKLVAISIMAAMLLALGGIAMASSTDWILLLKASTGQNTLASNPVQCGTVTGATDGYDAGKDTSATLVASNAGLAVYQPSWTSVNPPLYGKDVRAPFASTDKPKSWDIVFWLGTSYAGTDAKVIWWNTTTATQQMMPTMAGMQAKYMVEVVNDPTGQNSGKKFELNPTVASTSTSPMGSLAWTGDLSSLKLAPGSAIDSGVKLRFTAMVPEPSSIFALASGLVGMAGFAIRRRK